MTQNIRGHQIKPTREHEQVTEDAKRWGLVKSEIENFYNLVMKFVNLNSYSTLVMVNLVPSLFSHIHDFFFTNFMLSNSRKAAFGCRGPWLFWIYCFFECIFLHSVNISSSLKTMGIGCFSDFRSHQSIDILLFISSLKSHLFKRCSSFISAIHPS